MQRGSVLSNIVDSTDRTKSGQKQMPLLSFVFPSSSLTIRHNASTYGFGFCPCAFLVPSRSNGIFVNVFSGISFGFPSFVPGRIFYRTLPDSGLPLSSQTLHLEFSFSFASKFFHDKFWFSDLSFRSNSSVYSCSNSSS